MRSVRRRARSRSAHRSRRRRSSRRWRRNSGAKHAPTRSKSRRSRPTAYCIFTSWISARSSNQRTAGSFESARVARHAGSPPRSEITQPSGVRVEPLDVARVAHIQFPGTLTLQVMREHGVAVDLGGVAVDRDQLVAEHVHRHLEVRDTADVVDQLGTIRERVRTPPSTRTSGAKHDSTMREVTPVDARRVPDDEVVDRARGRREAGQASRSARCT